MNRGRRREKIFFDDKDKKVFLDLIGDITSLFEAEIHAYVLMSNHYHLLIHTPAGNLSRCMRHLNGVYTQRFNVKHKIDGSLFRGRFKAILIEEESYLLELVRYIHQNPKKARLENEIGEYEWCSHRGYIKKSKRPEWLEVTEVLRKFSKYEKEAKRGLEAFVKKEIPKDLLKRLESINWPTMLGGKEFKKKIKEKYLGEEIAVKEKPAYRRDIIRSEQAKEEVNRLVSDNREMLEGKRIRKYSKRRRALIYVLRRYYALNLKEISEIMGGVTYSAVSKQYGTAEREVRKGEGCCQDVEEMDRIIKFNFKT